ncbi:HD-GYP domain-containing protein [Pseudodesulfovibrio sediminis]|uniref:HD family phosphohydrolase n=1 Tax=Pseudodesulfovibrio sediminis TaxID=2810563 RepID=A0ABN6EP56_9BACT|nr:HD domain-containing phosphohydrolase [Pseudodesulfovibrio sediminis]BCS88193.1 HD family phosphohydrolase [Pseudodesulfovibrio sediminis]
MSDTRTDESFGETYLQISPNILETFPKFRPPVDLYVFDTKVGQVKKYHKARERLSLKGQGEVADFALEGQLYLLRDDYLVYAEHLSKQLGLLLVEEGFTPVEVAEILFLAFRNRVETFFDQPQEAAYKDLVKDISILAEYIWTDPARLAFLTRTLDREYNLAVHSVNTMFIGLAIYAKVTNGRFERNDLVNFALGFILHDLGMTMVPRFIKDKEQYLVRRDRESIQKHIDAGLNMLKRLKVDTPVIIECMSQHHERLDGSGYPERRVGKGISLAGRVCALADSFSAMIGERPYRGPRGITEAALSLTEEPTRYETVLAKILAVIILEGEEDRAESC